MCVSIKGICNVSEEPLSQPLSGNKYVQFGAQILQDETGARVNNMEHKHLRDAERINTEILCEWLNGKGKQPVTWATLIEVLSA